MTSTLRLPAPVTFCTTFAMSHGARNWPFLDVHDPAGLGGGDEEIGLPAQERRDLQHVDRLGDARALRGLVDIGEHRHADALADFGEDRQRPFEADAARTLAAGAVRLVERGLVDEPDAEMIGELLQALRHFKRMGAAFQRARPGDQCERE